MVCGIASASWKISATAAPKPVFSAFIRAERLQVLRRVLARW